MSIWQFTNLWTFKVEFFNQHSFTSDENLDNTTDDYVYGYDNQQRLHFSNGYMVPFEKQYRKRWHLFSIGVTKIFDHLNNDFIFKNFMMRLWISLVWILKIIYFSTQIPLQLLWYFFDNFLILFWYFRFRNYLYNKR